MTTEPAAIDEPRTEPDLIELREEPPADKPAKNRGLRITAAILAATVLILAVIFGPAAWRILTQKDATLTLPETIGNHTRDDSPNAKQAANDLLIALQSAIELDTTAAAIYKTPAAGPTQNIFFFGGTALLYNPEKELDTVIKLMADTNDHAGNLKTVDPGPLGGIMRCGPIDDDTAGTMSACFWADHGSIAMALFPGQTPDEAATLMRQIRAATLTR